MKKESASRRKKLPLLLGALLIISVAAYGTRAYFSDSAQMQGNIQLSLGDVDISTDGTTSWIYKPLQVTGTSLDKNDSLGATVESDGSIKNAENITSVRPGDSFTRTYSIKNNGSLDVKVKLTSKEALGQLSNYSDKVLPDDGAFTTTITGLKDEFPLKSKESKTFDVTITVKTTVGDSFNTGSNKYEIGNKTAVNYLEKAININAEQTNKK
ncbi:MAG: hypothetical protein ABS862_06980 [Carnobacterium inhibens]